jgi:hypothetical protein
MKINTDPSARLGPTTVSDYPPVCSLDQKWEYYVDFGHISRVPLDGSGKTEAINGMPQDYGAGMLNISPDGKSLATVVTKATEAAVKIAVFDLGSSSPPRMLRCQPLFGDELAIQSRREVRSLCDSGERDRQRVGAAAGRFCGPSDHRFQVGTNLVIQLVAGWEESRCSARPLRF